MNLGKTFTMLVPLAVVAVSGASSVLRGEDLLVIARDGKAQYTIVYADQASDTEKTALQELTDFLGRVTGASFPVMAESAFRGDTRGIYVGWTKSAAQRGIEVAKLGEEEWVIRSAGEDLILTGGRPRGTLYAVYEFLEQQVGCHWLARDTEVVPTRPTLAFPKPSIQARPFIWMRDIYTTYHTMMPTAEMAKRHSQFLTRNKHSVGNHRFYGSPGSCHTFFQYLNARDWFDTRPEYFSLVGGKRLPAKDGNGPGQLCLTNPDVRRIVVERLRGFVKQDREKAAKAGVPPPRIYDISQNDAGAAECQCENCQAIAKREGSESGPMIDFINAIADSIKGEYPDILVQTFAYNRTEPPPKTLKPRANVIVRWCDVYSVVDLVRPLSHPYNSKNYGEILAWGKIAPHLAIWDYWISYGYYQFPTPYCMIQCIGPDMKLFVDMHAETLFCESEEDHEYGENFTALKYWLGYKMMVNPYQPVEPLIQTFMDGYFGAAAPRVDEYMKYLQGRIDREAEFRMVRNAPHELKYLDLDFFRKATELFDAAEALVKPGSLAALHVQRERLVVDGALLYLWPWLDRKLPADAKMPFDHETVISRYETNWNAQFKAFFSQKAQAIRQAKVARLAALFRAPKLPEPFRALPSRDVADFNWLTFSPYSPGRQTFVEDSEAAGGMAAAFVEDKEKPDEHKKPLTFGVTGGATITLKPEDVPQDGKYHVFKIGRTNVKKGTTAWAHASRRMGVNVDRLVVADAKDPKVNDWDVFISLKVRGPDYVKGSTEAGGLWLDRVLLVRPPKDEKADAAELRRQAAEAKTAARRAAGPPQVRLPRSPRGADGDPLKVAWDTAVPGGEWCTLLGYPTARKVDVRFAHDGKYLYLRLTEEVDPARLTNDPGIWAGDDWELFFAPQRGTKPYRQIGINPKGDHVELAYGEASGKWDSGVKVISETAGNSWTVSLAFPLSRLLPGGVSPGQTVYANILRGADGGRGDTLAWSPNFESNFHSLDRLGEIILE